MQLQSDNYLLNDIASDDLDQIYQGLSDPRVIAYYGVSFQSKAATQEQMDWYTQIEEEQTGKWWSIKSKDEKEFVGAVGLNNINKSHLKGEIGFWLLPDYWGKSIMMEVIPIVLMYGFESLNLHQIEAFVESENHNSMRLLEKLGFQYEETHKDCEIKSGEYLSLQVYAMRQSNWSSSL